MDKIIKILNLAGSGFLGLTIFFGYRASYDVNNFVVHIYIALFAASLTIMGQVAIFFYLLATGSSIKEVANDLDFGIDVFKETRRFKSRTFPFAMLTILLVIATTAMGGAVHTGIILPYIHGSAAWVAICASLFSTLNASKSFKKNKALIMRVIEAAQQQAKVSN